MSISPTVRHLIFDGARGDSRATRDNRFHASLVNNKIAHLADEALIDQSPKHVGTVMTIGRLVEGFLREIVAMAVNKWGNRLQGRGCGGGRC